LALSDAGNAARFCERYKSEFAHSPGIGWGLLVDGQWIRGTEGNLESCAKKTVEMIRDEAQALEDFGQDVIINSSHRKRVWRSAMLRAWADQCEADGLRSVMMLCCASGLMVAPGALEDGWHGKVA